MLFAPVRLGSTALSAEVLTADVKNCKHFGPCGVGEKALYLNVFLFDRHYYVALGDIRRVFKRVDEHTNPAHKWVALAIVLAGLIAAVYGVIAWRRQEGFGMYFTLLGLAVVFLFSGTQVIPTMKNNKRAVTAAWEQAQKDMAGVLPEHFPLPARYAHPVVLDRMIRVLREGRAQNAEEALAVVKADLKALNADVQVSQEEYDEVVAIKPMFLVSDYE